MPQQSYKPDRLRRALAIIKRGGIEKVGPQQYKVVGNDEPHYYVDLMQDPPCTCKDQEYRPTDTPHHCKHALCARLLNGDVDLLIRVGEMLEVEQSR